MRFVQSTAQLILFLWQTFSRGWIGLKCQPDLLEFVETDFDE